MEKGFKALYSGGHVKFKHYISVYNKFVSTSFTQASSFRLSFFLVALMDIIFYLSTLFSVTFIFDHVQHIGPWNKDQLLFFISFMLTLDHFHMTTVSESFWRFSEHIRTGSLDFILLKPTHSIFNVFFSRFRPATLANGIVAWSFLIYYGMKINLPWFGWALIPILILLAFNLLLVIEIILSTAMFWIVEGAGVNFLRMQLQQLARWPDFIYTYFTRKILTLFLPLLLIGTAPVKFLLDFHNYDYLVYMVLFSILFWILCFIWWKYALRKYESASS